MKYVHEARSFTTEEFSIQETIQEIKDVISIAKAVTQNNVKNLDEIEYYLEYVSKKVDKALEYVPKDVQEKEHL